MSKNKRAPRTAQKYITVNKPSNMVTWHWTLKGAQEHAVEMTEARCSSKMQIFKANFDFLETIEPSTKGKSK